MTKVIWQIVRSLGNFIGLSNVLRLFDTNRRIYIVLCSIQTPPFPHALTQTHISCLRDGIYGKLFLFYKNKLYKNKDAQIEPKFKNRLRAVRGSLLS